MVVNHPLIPFTIEIDELGRFLKRSPSGAVEASNFTEYALGLMLMQLYPLAKPPEVEVSVPAPEKVNLNTASVEAIAALPGFGDASAAKVVAHREPPYTDLDDVLKKCSITLTKAKREELSGKVEF